VICGNVHCGSLYTNVYLQQFSVFTVEEFFTRLRQCYFVGCTFLYNILKCSIFCSVCTIQMTNLQSHYWDAMHEQPQWLQRAILHPYANIAVFFVSADHTSWIRWLLCWRMNQILFLEIFLFSLQRAVWYGWRQWFGR